MRDDLMRLHPEAKMCRRIVQPVLDSRFFDQLTESEIHFDRIELHGVVAQELFLRQLGGVEFRLPRWISPSRGSCEELRHDKDSFVSLVVNAFRPSSLPASSEPEPHHPLPRALQSRRAPAPSSRPLSGRAAAASIRVRAQTSRPSSQSAKPPAALRTLTGLDPSS